jgi:hypothetical protein
VQGLIFAKAADKKNVGYALSTSEFKQVATHAEELTSRVDTGQCHID